MGWLRFAFEKIRALAGRDRLDRELDEELKIHLEISTADYIARGVPQAEARKRALMDLGGIDLAREIHRETRGVPWLEGLWQDSKYALRALRNDARFTVMALAVLTLGIGANTAVFSIVNGVLRRPLPYGHSERLVSIQEVIPQLAHVAPVLPVNGRHYLDWARNARTLESLALIRTAELNLTGAGEPERLQAAKVTANLFDVLGVPAQLGRTLVPDDSAREESRVAVITDSLWRGRFASSRQLIGQTVELNGAAYVVVGVLGRDFRPYFRTSMNVQSAGKYQIEVYTPWKIDENEWGWAGEHNYACVGRMKAGVTPRQVQAELDVLQAGIATRFENTGKMDLLSNVTALQDHVVVGSRKELLLLLAAVGAVLLIASFNLGNLMLVRALARRREAAVRAALGATRFRLASRSVLEGLYLALSAAGLGAVLAYQLLVWFRISAPSGLPRADEVSLDWLSVLFAVGVSLAAAVIFGLIPFRSLWRVHPQEALRAGGRSATESRSGVLLRETIVGIEVALSVCLLIVAGLLVNSFRRLQEVDRGFRPEKVLTAEVSLPATRYGDDEKRRRFLSELLRQLNEQPEISSAGVSSLLPLRGQIWTDIVRPEGDKRPIAELPIVPYRAVSAEYFEAMGIPIAAGRSLQESDYPRLTAVISARAAAQIWPGQNPIGKRFSRAMADSGFFEVVGIAGDVRSAGLDLQPEPTVYSALWARVPRTAAIAVRTRVGPREAAATLRKTVWSQDPLVPVSAVQTMQEIEDDSTAPRRFLMMLVAGFSLAALLIAGLGTYSVLAYTTSRRRQEIGIRLVLGASPPSVAWMAVRQGVVPVVIGVAAGVAGALALGGILSSLLFEVVPNDPITFVAVTALMSAAAGMACFVPARRAAAMDPAETVRYE